MPCQVLAEGTSANLVMLTIQVFAITNTAFVSIFAPAGMHLIMLVSSLACVLLVCGARERYARLDAAGIPPAAAPRFVAPSAQHGGGLSHTHDGPATRGAQSTDDATMKGRATLDAGGKLEQQSPSQSEQSAGATPQSPSGGSTSPDGGTGRRGDDDVDATRGGGGDDGSTSASPLVAK